LREVQVQVTVIPSIAQHNDSKRNDWNKEDIEDTEEDEAVSDIDLVSAIIETISDRVQEPEEDGPSGEKLVVDRYLKALGGDEAGVQERSRKEEVGYGAIGEEAPLVVGGCHGAGEPRGYPGPDESDVKGDGCPADAGDQAKGDDERCPAHKPKVVLTCSVMVKSRRDIPVDILSVEDFTVPR